jgi:hypothetical protein
MHDAPDPRHRVGVVRGRPDERLRRLEQFADRTVTAIG